MHANPQFRVLVGHLTSYSNSKQAEQCAKMFKGVAQFRSIRLDPIGLEYCVVLAELVDFREEPSLDNDRGRVRLDHHDCFTALELIATK